MRYFNKRSNSGFTLVELATVVTIVAVLTGSALVLGSKRIEQQKVEDTKARLEMIERALQNFANTTGRLPCPADPTEVPSDDEDFGIGKYTKTGGNAGECNEGSIMNTSDDNGRDFQGGMVPVATLGLPWEMAYDAWGRKIMYYVTERAAEEEYYAISGTENTFMELNGPNSSCGAFTIEDKEGNIIKDNVLYVLWSAGQDGHGAFLDSGSGDQRVNVGNSNTSTLDNIDITETFDGEPANMDAVFRAHAYYKSDTDVDDVFDDILAFKTRGEMVLGIDKRSKNVSLGNVAVENGWLYVPEFTLPDGTFVPAFKVMKYEGEDDDGDDIADPPTGMTEPVELNYDEARMACQAYGRDSTTGLTGTGGLMEYDIITESQWLSISHQIVKNGANWKDGCVASVTGQLQRGKHDTGETGDTAEAGIFNEQTNPGENDKTPYYDTGDLDDAIEGGYRRTFFLPSGEQIWDLTGNEEEWVYCDMPYCEADGFADDDTFFNGEDSSGDDYYEEHLLTGSDHTGTGIEARSPNIRKAAFPPFPWTDDELVGSIQQEETDDHDYHFSDMFAIQRGGDEDQGNDDSGPFTVAILDASSGGDDGAFRCVHNFRKVPTFSTALPRHSFNPRALEGLDIWYDATDIDADGIPDYDSDNTGSIDDTDLSDALDTGCSATTPNDGCITKWMNKATNNRYHAHSKRLNGSASGTDNNMPTLIRDGIERGGAGTGDFLPAVNFSASNNQWLDTWSGVADAPDTGTGYSFNGADEMTIFIVANATDYDAIVAATDEDSDTYWPFFTIFPYDRSNIDGDADYVFATNILMGASDSSNDMCAFPGKHADFASGDCTGGPSPSLLAIDYTGPSTHDGTESTWDAQAGAMTYPHGPEQLIADGFIEISFNLNDDSCCQFLFSKDSTHGGSGGHISIAVDGGLGVRFQTPGNPETDYYVQIDSADITTGVDYTIRFEWGSAGMKLFHVTGVSSDIGIPANEVDTDAYTGGVTNPNYAFIGASGAYNSSEAATEPDDVAYFDGTIYSARMGELGAGGTPENADVNYACGMLGGITASNGLIANENHIASGIFTSNSSVGISTYVDGRAVDRQDSIVSTENEDINDPAHVCSGDTTNMLLNIGMDRSDNSVRTIGNVGEIIIYDRALTPEERILVERYLADKWNIEYLGPTNAYENTTD